MNILVTLNSNYIRPLKVMLWSLFFNHPGQHFHVYLMHSSIPDEELFYLDKFIRCLKQELTVITVQDSWFVKAPVVLHYSKEMYYRLLAYKFLPDDMDRILYLDPDVLVINPIGELYHTDLDKFLYAAAFHNSLSIKEMSKIRLKAYAMTEYFNSGVLMMNLKLQRDRIREEEIYAFIVKHKNRLLYPDQDVLNALYGKEIKKLDELKYNFDTRFYQHYKVQKNGAYDMEAIMKKTAILHFCGKKKPWQKKYMGKFHALYAHYESLALRMEVNERTGTNDDPAGQYTC